MDHHSIIARQRSCFQQGVTRPRAFRRQQLKLLKQALLECEPRILKAVHQDMGRPETETYSSEIMLVLKEIDHALKHLDNWMKPQRVRTGLLHQPGRSYRLPQPFGTVLIIGAWNYPFMLLLYPLVGALAAGNTAVLKIPETAEHSARVMTALVRQYFDPAHVATVEGGPAETRQLLDQPFDYIFYTGSTAVGRQVMAQAAAHLTPVTLELGGKSPCIVTPETNLATAARRICMGKCFNAGQSCIAPDYLLVHETVQPELLDAIKQALARGYGTAIQQSPDYARIINQQHFRRLMALREGQTVFCGGETDAADLFMAPTLLVDVAPDSPVMQEEIFGPLLPVLTYTTLDEAIRFVNNRPQPLALYLFTDNRETQQRILRETASGSVTINETLTQIASRSLPFGGMGESGMGSYHGRKSFDTFTHYRSVLHRSIRLDLPIKYAPYRVPLARFKQLLRWLG